VTWGEGKKKPKTRQMYNTVLDKGGRVVFVDDDTLSEYSRADMPSVDTLDVIGVFDDDAQATAAAQSLEQAGFSNDDISVLGDGSQA